VEQTAPRFFELGLDKSGVLSYNIYGAKEKTAAEHTEEAENDKVS
jgi:hypothetical protein